MKKIVLLIFAGFLFGSLFHLQAQTPIGDENYIKTIENERAQKDISMKDSPVLQLNTTTKANFKGLNYYPVDAKFKVAGTFIPASTQEMVPLTTTAGKVINLVKYGTVRFIYENTEYQLTIFKNSNLSEFGQNPDQLFIPFKDLTSGGETNKNGRYLPITITNGSNKVELDFNRAFNPYSAYNPAYEGVIPPQANVLDILFQSGERKYEDR